jgi:hypothetical protein
MDRLQTIDTDAIKVNWILRVLQISTYLITVRESSTKEKPVTPGINRTPAAPDATPPHHHLNTSPPYH